MHSGKDVSFDQYGHYEIRDPELLSAISGGHLLVLDPNNPEGNTCCYNRTCCNELCVTVANMDLYCGPNPLPSVPPNVSDRTCALPNVPNVYNCNCPPPPT